MRRRTPMLPLALALAVFAPYQASSLAADQEVTLPAPIHLQNFDALAELALPSGWTVWNETTTVVEGEDIDNLRSDTYKNWVVISAERLQSLKGRAMQSDVITLNGEVLEALATGNLIYAESDVRSGNQVQYFETADYDMTGRANVYAAFHSLYEQNQDNINGMEYSVDGGATWHPGLYYLYGREDTGQGGPDILLDTIGNIDLAATLNTARTDHAHGRAYGAFLSAPITPETALYIQGRINDNPLDGKRIEIVRLKHADNQAKVRFRFFQAGTGSWYWGVDNLGLYSIDAARIALPPHTLPNFGRNAQVNLGGSVTFNVAATGTAPLSYQWFRDGNAISGATGATLAINNARTTDAGEYTVRVSNSQGEMTSEPSILSVLATPQIDAQPQGVLVSSGAPFSLTVQASGPGPITYQWQRNEQNISGATSATYSVSSAAAGDAGTYRVVVTNPNGSSTSADARVTVFTGAITEGLVVHLPFDTDARDTSGKNNHGTPEAQTLLNGTDPGLPTFSGGGSQLIGGGAVRIRDGQAINLGTPEDLFFGTDVSFTVSFWVKAADANAWTGDPSFFSNKNWTSGSSQGYVVAAQGGGTFKWNWKGSDQGRRDLPPSGGFSPTIADNQWHNIVITHDRQGVAAVYLDGVLKATAPIAGDGDIDSFGLSTYIGQDGTGGYGFANDQGAHFLDILMDDFGIWRRVLTPQEAASIYAQGLQGQDLTKASGEVVILPPNATAGPASQTVSAGASVTLTATVEGTAPFTYQWQKDGADLPGATSATLTLENVTAASAGAYRVVATNPRGSSTSPAGRLAVTTAALGADLVAHLKFNGDYSDSSGRGNNAAAAGAPTFEAGKLGQALRVITARDGSKIDYASLGTKADVQFGDSTDFSVAFWVNVTSNEADPSFISNKDWNSSSNPGWGIFAQGGGNLRINATGTPGSSNNRLSTTSTPNIRDGNWHHVTVTFWRGQVAATYVDGQLVNSTPLTTTGTFDTGLPLNIGQDGTGTYTDGGSAGLNALIDDVGIWRRVLSVQQVSAIYTGGQAGNDLSALTGGGPSDVRIGSIARNGNNVVITVEGAGNFQLQRKSSLSDAAWINVGEAGASGSFTVPADGQAGFFRVQKL